MLYYVVNLSVKPFSYINDRCQFMSRVVFIRTKKKLFKYWERHSYTLICTRYVLERSENQFFSLHAIDVILIHYDGVIDIALYMNVVIVKATKRNKIHSINFVT